MNKDLEHKQNIVAQCYQLALQEAEVRGEFFRIDEQAISYLDKIIATANSWEDDEKAAQKGQ